MFPDSSGSTRSALPACRYVPRTFLPPPPPPPPHDGTTLVHLPHPTPTPQHYFPHLPPPVGTLATAPPTLQHLDATLFYRCACVSYTTGTARAAFTVVTHLTVLRLVVTALPYAHILRGRFLLYCPIHAFATPPHARTTAPTPFFVVSPNFSYYNAYTLPYAIRFPAYAFLLPLPVPCTYARFVQQRTGSVTRYAFCDCTHIPCPVNADHYCAARIALRAAYIAVPAYGGLPACYPASYRLAPLHYRIAAARVTATARAPARTAPADCA